MELGVRFAREQLKRPLHGRITAMAEKLVPLKRRRNGLSSTNGPIWPADEIALILYLLSDAGAYATGQPFIIDGGAIA